MYCRKTTLTLLQPQLHQPPSHLTSHQAGYQPQQQQLVLARVLQPPWPWSLDPGRGPWAQQVSPERGLQCAAHQASPAAGLRHEPSPGAPCAGNGRSSPSYNDPHIKERMYGSFRGFNVVNRCGGKRINKSRCFYRISMKFSRKSFLFMSFSYTSILTRMLF